jgi:NADPH2:quinone reductase
MRAVVCRELGPPEGLTIGELPEPEPGPGQVVIEVETASYNFPDLLVIRGAYQFRPEPPFAPGAEAAGRIAAIGSDVEGFTVGQRVAAVGAAGAFAERWAVDATATIPLPDRISAEIAAASSMTYGTSYHALVQRADLRPGETLLVLGAAGGVGSAAVELGKALGARVIAAASTQDKLDFCSGLGADGTINYAEDDLRERISALTGGSGVDVVYDPVGGELSEAAFRSIAWGGRHLVVGFTAGDIPRIPLNLPLLKGASLVGVFWGTFATRDPAANRANAAAIHAMIADGTISPRIMDTVAFEDFGRGFTLMSSRSVMGKLLLAVR